MTKPRLDKASAWESRGFVLSRGFVNIHWCQENTQLNNMRDAVTFITCDWRATRNRTSSPSITSSTSLKDKITMDFAFFAINVNINKMA